MSWRDHIKVHPAADLFPMMSDDDLAELGKNIRDRGGLLQKLVFYKGELLDGRNRLEALEHPDAPLNGMDARDAAEHLDPSIDPYEYVISANLHRRHLTGEQKRELIDKVLKAKPEASDSQIAKQTKTSDKTVAKRRRKLESTSEIPRLEKTVGKDGKKRGRPPKRKAGLSPPRPARPLDPYAVGDACVVPSMEAESAPARATGSAEISIEQRRAEMAQLGEDGRSAAPIFEEMDLVDSALAYLAMMDPQQRDRFFKKCTELYGAVIETPHDDAERRSPSPPINVEIGPEHKIPDDLSVPDFLRRVPA